ncbi:hypothetical protein, partial [Pseudomonas lini]|uniref:hypothetical protein n=1 Tax=Pseudomonas lini TaxID=163011 RepID=UPI001E496992
MTPFAAVDETPTCRKPHPRLLQASIDNNPFDDVVGQKKRKKNRLIRPVLFSGVAVKAIHSCSTILNQTIRTTFSNAV